MQRHHLLPRQLASRRCFGPLFDAIGQARLGFEDFRTNGLLLPASDAAALRLALPLHRGPHRTYNALVMERVGRIEASWSLTRWRLADRAVEQALMRLGLLQRALRRRLLSPARQRLALNRNDPLGHGLDFTELDAMADQLWSATEIAPSPGNGGHATELAALSMARTLAVATSSSMPTPQIVRPSGVSHST